jgi:hypothetical protein
MDHPPPLVPPHIDVSDLPPPRELFIKMAIQMGMSRACAEKLVDESLIGRHRRAN